MIILRQKEFARRNYEGLNKVQQKELKEARSKLAKELLERKKSSNEFYNYGNSLAKDVYNSEINLKKKLMDGGVLDDFPKTKARLEGAEDKLKHKLDENLRSRNESHKKDIDRINESAEQIEKSIRNQSFKTKVKNYKKALWNGEVGKLGKTGNRALMIGIPTLTVAGGTALALRKKNKKEE